MAKRKQSKKTGKNAVWWLLFIIYIGVMGWLLFGRAPTRIEGLTYRQMLLENLNYRPFYTIDNYINVIVHYPDSPYYSHCIRNLMGNIFLFIPTGIFLPKLFPALRKFFLFLVTVLLVILFVELLQLFTLLGSFDVDDIILNISGMLAGYILYACFTKKK